MTKPIEVGEIRTIDHVSVYLRAKAVKWDEPDVTVEMLKTDEAGQIGWKVYEVYQDGTIPANYTQTYPDEYEAYEDWANRAFGI